jgi:hypothetical protein
MEFKRDAYCGLYCGACPHLVATEKQDEDTLKVLAQRATISLEDAHCHGCKSDQVAIWCRDCNLKTCARRKGVDFCSECDEYPCADFIAFRDTPDYPYHAPTPGHLQTIAENGLVYWLDEQDTRWRCPMCQTRFNWFDTTCPECGSTVRSWSD